MPHKSASQLTLGSDEYIVLRFLENWPESFVSETEIARRADGKKRYLEDPDWASGVLGELAELKLIEQDNLGRYRVNAHPAKKCIKTQQFISPRLREILKRAGYCANCLYKDCVA
jgi:hypothetical protein